MRSTYAVLLAVGVGVVITIDATAQQRPPAAASVPGLTPAQQLAFDAGSRIFSKSYDVADGLGPVFNDRSCVACHRNGGGGNRTVTRFGRVDDGIFDPLTELGGSLVQSRGIGVVTTVDGTHDFGAERPPTLANTRALRRTTPLFGLGLVDAVALDTWLAIAQAELDADPDTAGRLNIVRDVSTGRAATGKFGWKAQVPTLFQFSGDALLNEMGITSPGFRDENCPQGDCDALAYNPAPALNDDGRDVEALTEFMTMLAPPVRGAITADVTAGEAVFRNLGCGSCHLATIRTGPSPIAAFNRTAFHPYSDFLLHDMGSLGDGIVQGLASGHEMRTAPLWGLRDTNRFLHDGSARSLEQAIQRHDGQAAAARDRFGALDAETSALLLAFLRSL